MNELLEWVSYKKFDNVKYIAEGGFGTVYQAYWNDGTILNWNNHQNVNIWR